MLTALPVVRAESEIARPSPVTVVLVAVIPEVPEFKVSPVVLVVLPRVIALAFAPVPMLTAPVVPESRDIADVVVEARVSVEPPVILVAPLPVRDADAAATVNRVVPLVSNARVFASVVPMTADAPNALPLFTKQVAQDAAVHESTPDPSVCKNCPAVPSSTGSVKMLF
jgi:hypothetical protein